MSDESHYEALLPILMAIPADQVIRDPKKNMGLVKQRAMDLYDQAKRDFGDLEEHGLRPICWRACPPGPAPSSMPKGYGEGATRRVRIPLPGGWKPRRS